MLNHKYREFSTTKAKPKQMVVMLHGLGSDADDLIELAPYLELKDCYFFSPNGIEKCDMLGFGYQWFSLQEASFPTLVGRVKKAQTEVMEIILSKARELEIETKDIILLGFSQGAMMSMYLALTSDIAFRGVLAFSGRLIISPDDIVQRDTPIALIHGDMDSVVPVSCMYEAQAILQQTKINHELCLCHGLAHSIDAKGLAFAKDFIEKISLGAS